MKEGVDTRARRVIEHGVLQLDVRSSRTWMTVVTQRRCDATALLAPWVDLRWIRFVLRKGIASSSSDRLCRTFQLHNSEALGGLAVQAFGRLCIPLT